MPGLPWHHQSWGEGMAPLQVTFLGTSSGVPSRSRNVSAVALRLPQRSELWLLDCGEGTQHQFMRSELRVSQLRRIFITHMHGDHVFGLPGLPLLASGRVTLQVALLSPAGRPIAITGDLAAFWAGSWAEVRKEMRGRYPKHAWPENPATT
jgi:ribonuclease BN (tRNA processing enzyme)